MDFNLPSADPSFTSRSQVARKATEAWAAQNFYCPSCGNGVTSFPTSTAVYDFYSADCEERFQLKSLSHRFSNSILGAKYESTKDRILNGTQPSFALLHYNPRSWRVEDLMVIHRACITLSCIVPRPPLNVKAERKGWVGFNILLHEIPELGKIDVIRNGLLLEKSIVLSQWEKTDQLLAVRPFVRGWTADVLACVEQLLSTFNLDDIYAFEDKLFAKHPSNRNVRPKIRQQLQLLRDLGLVRFVGRGTYEYIGKQRSHGFHSDGKTTRN